MIVNAVMDYKLPLQHLLCGSLDKNCSPPYWPFLCPTDHFVMQKWSPVFYLYLFTCTQFTTISLAGVFFFVCCSIINQCKLVDVQRNVSNTFQWPAWWVEKKSPVNNPFSDFLEHNTCSTEVPKEFMQIAHSLICEMSVHYNNEASRQHRLITVLSHCDKFQATYYSCNESTISKRSVKSDLQWYTHL